MEKILVFDANNLIHRAYFACDPNEMHCDGKSVSGLYALSNMVMGFLAKYKPDRVIAAFDSGKSLRLEQFDSYKESRKKKADTLKEQFPLAKKLFTAWGITIIESNGWEADDILATVAEMIIALRAIGEEKQVYLVSADKDILQVVAPGITVVEPIHGASKTKEWTEKEFLQSYSFPPNLLPDFKALYGDKSDDIPGIHGIGKEKAIKLVSEFGTIENILTALEEGKISGPKMVESLNEGKESLFEYRKLATLSRSVPIKTEIKPFSPRLISVQKFFIRWKFKTLIKRAELLVDELRRNVS